MRPLPGPEGLRADAGLAVLFAVGSFTAALLYQRTGIYSSVAEPWVWAVGILFGSLPLAARRRRPVPAAIGVSIGFFVIGQFGVPDMLMVQIAMFLAMYSIGAWERNRTLALWARVGITAAMFVWIIVNLIVSSSDAETFPGLSRSGIFSAYATFAVIQILTNIMYFGGAFYFGERSWRGARTQALLEARTRELELERGTNAAQAVALDRLEIARELHDVVAHHISIMGIQAAAARRSLADSPGRAAQALEVVETSAHSAVTELRALLHTLRSPGEESSASTVGVAHLAALVDEAQSAGTPARLIVAGTPRPLPLLVDVALYRVVQEALTNVRKHAGRGARATVRLRFEHDAVEVEVSDDGLRRTLESSSPAPGADGLGLGLRGMRERIAAVGGTLEYGRREGTGFITRARVPVPDPAATSDRTAEPADPDHGSASMRVPVEADHREAGA